MADEQATTQDVAETDVAASKLTLEEALREIRALRKENGDRRTKLREFEEAQALKEKERLAAEQQWQKLAEQYRAEAEGLKPKAEKADVLEAHLKETLSKRIEAVPKQMRSLVPEYDDPARTLSWLDANAAMLKMPAPPATDAGATGDAPAKPLEADTRQLAAKMGISMKDAERYLNG